MLLAAAAAELGVSSAELDTDAGEVVHAASGRASHTASWPARRETGAGRGPGVARSGPVPATSASQSPAPGRSGQGARRAGVRLRRGASGMVYACARSEPGVRGAGRIDGHAGGLAVRASRRWSRFPAAPPWSRATAGRRCAAPRRSSSASRRRTTTSSTRRRSRARCARVSTRTMKRSRPATTATRNRRSAARRGPSRRCTRCATSVTRPSEPLELHRGIRTRAACCTCGHRPSRRTATGNLAAETAGLGRSRRYGSTRRLLVCGFGRRLSADGIPGAVRTGDGDEAAGEVLWTRRGRDGPGLLPARYRRRACVPHSMLPKRHRLCAPYRRTGARPRRRRASRGANSTGRLSP